MSKFEERAAQCFCAFVAGRPFNADAIKVIFREITQGLLDVRKQVPTDEDKSSPK